MSPGRPGRKPQFSPAEIRRLMTAHGQRHLEADGVSVGLDCIRFDDVARQCGIARASAYRAWEDESAAGGHQQRLRNAVARVVLVEQADAGRENGGTLDDTLAAVTQLIGDIPDLATLGAGERWEWLQEIMRVGGNANHRGGLASRIFHAYVALAAGIGSRRLGVADPLWEAWRAGEKSSRERYLDLYQTLAVAFGLRLRPGLTWDQFGTLTDALAEGIAIRAPANRDGLDHIDIDTPHQSDETGWSLYAVGFEALAKRFLEPDPDAAHPTRWDMS